MDTLMLVKDAVRAGQRLWRPGYRYAKAGIVLLPRAENVPETLLASVDPERSVRLMGAMDSINERYGRRTVSPARTGLAQRWSMRRQRLSPRYTTDVDELLEAHA